MSFENIWYVCISGAAASGVVICAITIILKLKSARQARAELHQNDILRHAKHTAENISNAVATSSTFLTLTQQRCGEPEGSAVIESSDSTWQGINGRLTGLDETKTSGAHILAGSIETALPYLARFSGWHNAWRAQQGATVDKQIAISSDACRPDLPELVTPPPLDWLCRKYQITIDCTQGVQEPWPAGWPDGVRHPWTVTLSRPGPVGKLGRSQECLTITTPFFQSTDHDGEPSAAAVLSSLLSDADVELYSSFEDWALSAGQDPGSPRARRIYLVCLDTAWRLRAFCGDEEELLSELRRASRCF